MKELTRCCSSQVRPVMLKPWLVRILGTRFFLWNALGVPENQLNMFLQDGSVEDFLTATLDPVPKLAPMRSGAYHYLLVRSSHPLSFRVLGEQDDADEDTTASPPSSHSASPAATPLSRARST